MNFNRVLKLGLLFGIENFDDIFLIISNVYLNYDDCLERSVKLIVKVDKFIGNR